MGRLEGCRVVVTRPEGRAEPLVRLLEAEGAQVSHIPLIRTEGPEDPAPLRQAAEQAWAGGFDWLVVTSPAGAAALTSALGACRPAQAGSLSARICAVGPATRQALEAAGYPVAAVPEEARGAAIPDALERAAGGPGSLKGRRVLLALADRADPGPGQELSRRGAEVVRVTAYRTVADEEGARRVAERVRRGEVDVVVLASPSAVQALAQALKAGQVMERGSSPGGAVGAATTGSAAAASGADGVGVVAIGPTTAEAARRAGLRVHMAAAPTPQALVEAAAELWQTLLRERHLAGRPAGPSHPRR